MKKSKVVSKVVWGGVLGGCAALALAPTAQAGGLFIPGTGPQAGGRAGAFVAKADDPSALAYNPAGFAKQDGWVVQVGANFVSYDLTFARAGVYQSPAGESTPYDGQSYEPISNEASPEIGFGSFQAVPLIAVSGDVGIKNLRIGFGLFAPQAYPNREFAADYTFEDPNEPPPPQRYDTMYQRAATALPSIAVSYRVSDKLDLGVRGTWGIGELSAGTHVWGIDNYEEWVSRDGYFEVEVSDNFVPAFGAGLLFRPTPSYEIGLAYASGLTVDAKGTGSSVLGTDLGVPGTPAVVEPENDFPACAPGGVDASNLKACVTLKLPQIATIGGRWILRDAAGGERADVEFDLSWEDWSNASDIEVVVDGKSVIRDMNGVVNGEFPLNGSVISHGFRDVLSARLGGSYTIPNAGKPVTFRGGVAYDTAAAPDSWRRVDQDGAARATFTGGLSYTISKLRVDLGAGYVFEPTATVAECDPTISDQGCPPGSGEIPVADRDQPDPVQPLKGAGNQVQSPFNGGTYESHYLLFSLGLTYFL